MNNPKPRRPAAHPKLELVRQAGREYIQISVLQHDLVSALEHASLLPPGEDRELRLGMLRIRVELTRSFISHLLPLAMIETAFRRVAGLNPEGPDEAELKTLVKHRKEMMKKFAAAGSDLVENLRKAERFLKQAGVG